MNSRTRATASRRALLHTYLLRGPGWNGSTWSCPGKAGTARWAPTRTSQDTVSRKVCTDPEGTWGKRRDHHHTPSFRGSWEGCTTCKEGSQSGFPFRLIDATSARAPPTVTRHPGPLRDTGPLGGLCQSGRFGFLFLLGEIIDIWFLLSWLLRISSFKIKLSFKCWLITKGNFFSCMRVF